MIPICITARVFKCSFMASWASSHSKTLYFRASQTKVLLPLLLPALPLRPPNVWQRVDLRTLVDSLHSFDGSSATLWSCFWRWPILGFLLSSFCRCGGLSGRAGFVCSVHLHVCADMDAKVCIRSRRVHVRCGISAVSSGVWASSDD